MNLTNTIKTYANPVLGKLDVRDIDSGLVMQVPEPIWTTIPETASRLRGRIERILGWAKVQCYREGENPARWTDNLDQLLPHRGKVRKVEPQPALPYDQVGAFMAQLREQAGITRRFILPDTSDIPADDYAPPKKRTQNIDPEPVPDYPASPVNHELEGDIARNAIDDLAALMRALTYGEMIELTKAIWKANGDEPITLERLPGIWHQWAKGNGDGGPLVH